MSSTICQKQEKIDKLTSELDQYRFEYENLQIQLFELKQQFLTKESYGGITEFNKVLQHDI